MDQSAPAVALGVKVFKRAEKLAALLESVPSDLITRAIIADDGEITPRKEAIYAAEYGFDIEVLDLPYDAGVGYGRQQVVEALTEEYLLFADPDHILPGNVSTLVDILERDQSLGGAAGALLGLEGDRVTIGLSGCDLFETQTTILRYGKARKTVESCGDNRLVEYDFIPQAAVYRAQCLEEYGWDPAYTTGSEHLDFHVGHWKQTDWRFGISPDVHIHHYPGGDRDYETNRRSEAKLTDSATHFGEKWGYEFEDTTPARYGWIYDRADFSKAGLLTENDRFAEDLSVEFFQSGEFDDLTLRLCKANSELDVTAPPTSLTSLTA
jgi:hypothetical protein